MHTFRSSPEVNCPDVVGCNDILHPVLRDYGQVKCNGGLYFDFPLMSFLLPFSHYHTGNYYSQGALRKQELINSCAVLGIPASKITVVDHK